MCVGGWRMALLLYTVFNAGATACWIAFKKSDDRYWPRRGERIGELWEVAIILAGFPFVLIWDFCIVPIWMRLRASAPTRETEAERSKTPVAAPAASYSTIIPIGDANGVRKKKRRRKHHRRF